MPYLSSLNANKRMNYYIVLTFISLALAIYESVFDHFPRKNNPL